MHQSVLEYVIQGNYGSRWEDLTFEDLYSEARDRVREYNENEPNVPHRIVARRATRAAAVVYSATPRHKDT